MKNKIKQERPTIYVEHGIPHNSLEYSSFYCQHINLIKTIFEMNVLCVTTFTNRYDTISSSHCIIPLVQVNIDDKTAYIYNNATSVEGFDDPTQYNPIKIKNMSYTFVGYDNLVYTVAEATPMNVSRIRHNAGTYTKNNPIMYLKVNCK